MVVDDPPLLTYREVADALRVSQMTVRRMVDRGELAAIKVGGSVRFDADEVRLLIRRGRGHGAKAKAA